MERAGIRSEWQARPPTVRLFVVGSLLGFVFSAVRDPSAFSFPAVVFSIVFLGLLYKLWDGERAMWWLFVIASVAGIVAGVTAAFDEPSALAGAAAGAVALLLLLASPTRAWVDQGRAGVSD